MTKQFAIPFFQEIPKIHVVPAQSSDPRHQLGEHTEHMSGSYITSDQNPQILEDGMHMNTVQTPCTTDPVFFPSAR
jgi:hypothetical protein